MGTDRSRPVLTVGRLIDEVGLVLVSGAESGSTPVRWVHSTELPDPTPWLTGGELVLTTGAQLGQAESQREHVGRLVDHGIAGLGCGMGFAHPELPEAPVAAARDRGFPVFEVPYELPFIAITERAFAHLVNDRFDVLQRSIAIQGRLEGLVLEERGLTEVVQVVAPRSAARSAFSTAAGTNSPGRMPATPRSPTSSGPGSGRRSSRSTGPRPNHSTQTARDAPSGCRSSPPAAADPRPGWSPSAEASAEASADSTSSRGSSSARRSTWSHSS